jgi:hypothetical protein
VTWSHETDGRPPVIPVAAFLYPIEHRRFSSRNVASAVDGGLERCVPGSRGPRPPPQPWAAAAADQPRPSESPSQVHAPVGSVHEPARKDAGPKHVSLLEPLQSAGAGAITNLLRP